MASLFKRARSRFYWIQYRDPVTRKIHRESTRFEFDIPSHRQKAREFRAEKTLFESRVSRSAALHRWVAWVPDFLHQRYSVSPGTLTRMLGAWKVLAEYLEEAGVSSPAHLTRQHCLDYPAWRRKRGHRNSRNRRPIAHNTVLMDLKALSSITQEAVRRQWIQFNPCFRLEIGREAPVEKKEMNDEQIEFVRRRIAERSGRATDDASRQRAEFLRVSFEIAIHQGCRMAETWLPLADIDLTNMEITFTAKGRKRYAAPLNPGLVPLFEEMVKKKLSHTYVRPRMPSLVWFKFMDRIRKARPDFDRISFHSTRVTVVSRAERAGVPEKVSMQLVNHSSTTVHRVYRKIKQHELTRVWEALGSLRSAGSPAASENRDDP